MNWIYILAGIIALVALARGFEKRPKSPGNSRILLEFLVIATLLAIVARFAA